MKKLFLVITLFIYANFYSQEYKDVVKLLLENKREDARNLFDKKFTKTKSSNIDLLFLDALINQEMGQLNFDISLLKSIENLPNSKNYIQPFINFNYIYGDINSTSFNDLVYEKNDFLSNSSIFKNLDIVKYRKAIAARKKLQFDVAKNEFENFGALTNWQFCGVFENLNGSGLETEYEPETYPMNDKLFDANSNGKVKWYIPKNKSNEIYSFLINEMSEYNSGIIYAQTFLKVDESKTYKLFFGTHSGIKIFINDVEIYSNNETGLNNIDAYCIKVNLNKGFNRILVKTVATKSSYFAMKLTNTDDSVVANTEVSAQFQTYNKSSFDELNPVETPTYHEQYFEDLLKTNPSNFLYSYYLFNSYLCNQKKDKLYDVVEEYEKNYPKSSLISTMVSNYYMLNEDYEKVKELNKNIEVNDKDYFLNVRSKVEDNNWISTTTIEELEKTRDASKKLKNTLIYNLYDLMICARKQDKENMIKACEKIVEESKNSDMFTKLYANFLLELKDDKKNYINTLEKLIASTEDIEASNALIEFYYQAGEIDKAKQVAVDLINKYPEFNSFKDFYINTLINEEKYDEAKKMIESNLENFPFSFQNMKKMAEVYTDMHDLKNAEKYIRMSLSHNSSNGTLRNQLYDITKVHDEIEDVETKDIYKYVKENRKTKLKGDFGVTLLLDEYIVNVFPEGGRKSKITYLYEITSEKGIDEMKEYSSMGSYDNLIKSEVIKEDGSIVPGEVGYEAIAFTDLKVGDVIFIQYDRFENGYGRFYKDFDISCYFNNVYPELEVSFTIIYPKEIQFETIYNNGNVPQLKKIVNGKNCLIWKKNNVSTLPLQEKFAPNYSDIINSVRISTIKEWKTITNWYADLVKKSIKIDKVTKNTFNQIFPNGFVGMTEEERAKKIYVYIEENINYSSLDFRQSGYVPQRPSKTILTKLGDCKDVSTLFISLAQLANVKANLVLVLTNDNDLNEMNLPSNEFNHCIVKANLDGKEYFMELTDKYLPFKSLPHTLYNAPALVISFDKSENENSKIIKIPFNNVSKPIVKTQTVINVKDDSKEFTQNIMNSGSTKAYYNELFATKTTDEIRKKSIEDDYSEILKKNIQFQSAKLIQNDDIFNDNLNVEFKFLIEERLKNVGSLSIMNVPFLNTIYNSNIINEEKRNFDIQYVKFENVHEYDNTIIINIPENKKLLEIPESKEFKFKNHSYTLKFEKVLPNQLKVIRNAKIEWDNILTSEYLEFKKFVQDVIHAEEQIIGFK